MPTRLLREGILSSDRVDQLTDAAELFYRRLMSKVDDFGLYDARPSFLRSSLYPLRVDRVREADCSRSIAACVKAGLIALYQRDGKPYLQMLDTGWQTRSEPKFPLPPWGKDRYIATANSGEQVQTPVPVFVFEDVVEDEDVNARARLPAPRKAKPKKTTIPDDFAVSDAVKHWAAERGFDRIGEHLESFVRKCRAKGYEYVDFDLAFMEAIREDWAKLRGRTPTGTAPPSVDDADRRAKAEYERSQSLLRQEAAHAAEVARQRAARIASHQEHA